MPATGKMIAPLGVASILTCDRALRHLHWLVIELFATDDLWPGQQQDSARQAQARILKCKLTGRGLGYNTARAHTSNTV